MPPKNKNYDKKIFRLVRILNYLDKGKKVSTRELAEEFNVTPRTIQRDLELLNMAGFPIVSEGGRHFFVEGFALRKTMLSSEEASLLLLLYEIVDELGESFKRPFQSILRKTVYNSSLSPFYVKMPQGIKLSEDFPYLNNLEEAVTECRKIAISYFNHNRQVKTYVLRPLKILFFDGFWYLLALKEGTNWMLKFRLEKIKDVRLLDDYFEMPDNLNLMLDESVNIWFGEKQDKKVVLKVEKEVAEFFIKRRYFPYQKIIEKDKDGSLIVESRVSQYMEVLPTILGWIPFVTVIDPLNLKQEVKEIIMKYLQKM